MNSFEATDLAVRILGCWKGPNAQEWEETLIDIDAGRAGTAFARLRREHDKQWLSIAEFLTVANALKTDDPHKPDPCGHCDDTGWIEADDIVKDAGKETERRYSAVKPCGCKEGRQRAQSAAWTDHNPPNQYRGAA